MDGFNGIVGVNTEPLFDATKYTTAGQPHLVEHLWSQFRAWLLQNIEARKKAKKPTIEIDEAVARATAAQFMAFCVKYLAKHRPVENFFVDTNHGLVLSNNARVVVSPGVDLRGTMQGARAVGVTAGQSQPGLNGVSLGEDHPIGII